MLEISPCEKRLLQRKLSASFTGGFQNFKGRRNFSASFLNSSDGHGVTGQGLYEETPLTPSIGT